MASIEIKLDDREVIKCEVCGLVQFRPRKNTCRRCLRSFPLDIFVLPPARAAIIEPPQDPEPMFVAGKNKQIVNNIGKRIKELREIKGLTQTDLQKHCQVSRSYLSKIEGCSLAPSIETLEQLAAGLQINIRLFFVSELRPEDRIPPHDPFIQEVSAWVPQLNERSRQLILHRLRAVDEHVRRREDDIRRKRKIPLGERRTYEEIELARLVSEYYEHDSNLVRETRRLLGIIRLHKPRVRFEPLYNVVYRHYEAVKGD